MYQLLPSPRLAQRKLDLPPGVDPGLSARLALARVRKLLSAFVAGMSADPVRLSKALAAPFAEAPLERERLFALGWLSWLAGDNAAAGPLLADAERRCREASSGEAPAVSAELPSIETNQLLARCAYWGARVRLLLDQGGAVGDYEAVMRKLGGDPQATAWYVDLLWRSGKVDRAEQVWKSLRANKRVLGTDDGPLFDARTQLRKGELGPAEKTLREAAPKNGVVWVERQLLLAWALSGMRQHDKAAELVQAARQGPYPSVAIDAWLQTLTARKEGRPLGSVALPGGWREFVRGQQARAAGRIEEAEGEYRRAMEVAAVGPFARFALVCLGREEASAVLPVVQGMFFAVRLRVRQAVDRFLRREIAPGDLLEAVRQARGAGYQPTGIEHYVRLAELLQQRQPTAADLSALIATEGAEGRNFRRVAFELSRRVAPGDALALLRQLAAHADEDLRGVLGRALFPLAVTLRDTSALNEAALTSDEPLLSQARLLLTGEGSAEGPVADLWRIANALASGAGLAEADAGRLRDLQKEPRWRHLASTLLLHEAAKRGDVAALAALLEQTDAWRGLRAPPASTAKALAAVISRQPGNAVWARTLPGWLGLWPAATVEKAAGSLLALSRQGGQGEAPPGIDAPAWFLHQAAAALRRGDARTALACVERVGDLDRVPDAAVVGPALPSLRRLAAAQALAECVGGQAESLTDLVDRLGTLPEGEAVVRAALGGDRETALAGLGGLAQRTDLSGELSHHLALAFTRQAEGGDPGAWRQAWPAWLTFLGGTAGPAPEARAKLLEHLLALHRRHVNDLLARGAFDPARVYWESAQTLPATASQFAPALVDDLTERATTFRDELATEYLVTTREAMRFGQSAEGLKADYEGGLAMLRRLLSLDGENVRLLTALVEICNDWFLDLYHLQDRRALREQVERHVPFATQLLRLLESQTGAHAARAALSDFYKVRGFVESDPERKAELYREALELNPGNQNVRDLLAELNAPPEGDEDEEQGDE